MQELSELIKHPSKNTSKSTGNGTHIRYPNPPKINPAIAGKIDGMVFSQLINLRRTELQESEETLAAQERLE